jgi:HAMP domain-containing protein
MFIGLRLRMLIGFTVLFSGVFAGAFYWFYNFTTEKTLERLRQDMAQTLAGAAKGVDDEELLALYRSGEVNSIKFSDDRRFFNQLNWLKTVNQVEPRAWVYTYVRGNQPNTRRMGEAIQTNNEVIFLVDLWATKDPAKAAKFLEPYAASTWMIESLDAGILVQRPEPYTDNWGNWISAYAPIKNDSGNVVAGIGIDIEYSYVLDVQKAIRNRMIIAFGGTYGLLFGLVYVYSGVITGPVRSLTQKAASIGEGKYDQDLKVIKNSRFSDEVSKLAAVFEAMVDKVRLREEFLKQQVVELSIEIDEAKRRKQVEAIVETDFFQELTQKANRVRQRSEAARNGLRLGKTTGIPGGVE